VSSPWPLATAGIDLTDQHIGDWIDGTEQRKDAITILGGQFAVLAPFECGVGEPLVLLAMGVRVHALVPALIAWSGMKGKDRVFE
jgi:hypothetical protein